MKILLVKLNHLGDTLILTPTVRFLRKQFPEARIDVLVRAGGESILQGNPDIDNVIATASPDKASRNLRATLAEFEYFFKDFFAPLRLCFDLSDSDRSKIWILLSASKVRGVNDAYQTLGGKKRMFNRSPITSGE